MQSERRDKEEPPSGIHIELPFISLRAGQGWRWSAEASGDDAYERARRRVRARLGFYRHLTTYLAVMVALSFLSLIVAGHLTGFVLWVAGLWGALLVWQAFNTFVFPHIWSKEAEERMIERELRRERGEDRPPSDE